MKQDVYAKKQTGIIKLHQTAQYFSVTTRDANLRLADAIYNLRAINVKMRQLIDDMNKELYPEGH